jgi:FixJ family two-component response regulator
MAIERSRDALRRDKNLQRLRERHDALSCREREVMALVVKGLLNKLIAAELGISEITVKVHRGKVMRKMQVRSLPELVIIAASLGDQDATRSTRSTAWPSAVAGPPLEGARRAMS